MPNLVHDMEMSFQQLPSELVINVLCNLDLCTLMRLARTATATKKFIELHGEVIYRHVVYGSLLEGRITCPSSGVMEAVKSVNDLPTVFSPSIVGELLGTMSDLYDRLSSWAEFGKSNTKLIRHAGTLLIMKFTPAAEVQAKLNRNWTDGPYRMNLQTMKVGGNWRFKLNPAERTVITSVVAGRLITFLCSMFAPPTT